MIILRPTKPPRIRKFARLPQCNKSNRLLRRYYQGRGLR